jgi:hypothetical protein
MKTDSLIKDLEKCLLEVERDHGREYPATVKLDEHRVSFLIKYLKQLANEKDVQGD